MLESAVDVFFVPKIDMKVYKVVIFVFIFLCSFKVFCMATLLHNGLALSQVFEFEAFCESKQLIVSDLIFFLLEILF